MEQLVLLYSVSDGCTYSTDLTLPFYYESVEKAEYDLLSLWEKHFKSTDKIYEHYFNTEVDFAGLEIDLLNLGYRKTDTWHYFEPTILKLNDWFERYAPPIRNS